MLKIFKAINFRNGNSNLVPVLLGSHTLDKLCLKRYYLTSTEFFVLYKFFVRHTKTEKLRRLTVCVCPQYHKFDKTYLMIAESKVVRCLSLRKAGVNIDSPYAKYAEKVGGFKF